jgi:hypothetical protein
MATGSVEATPHLNSLPLCKGEARGAILREHKKKPDDPCAHEEDDEMKGQRITGAERLIQQCSWRILQNAIVLQRRSDCAAAVKLQGDKVREQNDRAQEQRSPTSSC